MINQTIKRSSGIEKHLCKEAFPFFTFARLGAQSSRSNTTEGKFAYKLVEGQGVGYHTGPIMPLSLIADSELRTSLLEAVEYLKSLLKEVDMRIVRKVFQAYLNTHELGALKFEVPRDLKGKVMFKLERNFFESILPKLQYVTALDISSDCAVVHEYKPAPWKHLGDLLFWMHGWPNEKLHSYEIPTLYLVFEAIEHPILSYRHSWSRMEETSINIEKYFDLKKDIAISILERVWIDETHAGWSAIYLTIAETEYQVICSNAFDPFEILISFGQRVELGNLPMVFTIEEEGPEKRFEAYDTGTEDLFVFILSNTHSEDDEPIIEGVFSRKAFSSMLKAAFKDFMEHRYVDAQWDWYANKNEPSFKERILNDPWLMS
jgi:hypothetical protein